MDKIYNKQKLYEVKEKYELQLRDPRTHESYEAVACLENALESLDAKLEGKPMVPFNMRAYVLRV